ncbi:MAG: bifunctional DNA-formamidopyrimidine glycosylase/DNA-(apurinic or apyrimidinic site) lyase [Mariprofundaceae bacterium]|nr:bifunctional DNA-formamidopyrimidine glycosylase/DNA-(apurinic or apyrimidinic site) lyase [Mariprofundaceae bacterium]
MPELPEVEVVCRGLETLLKGKILRSSHAFRVDLRYPLPDFSVLHGACLEKICRRSKYILMYFTCRDGEQRILCWHLGMTGQFHVLDADISAGSHEHVRFDFNDGCSLRYRDARRFGYANIFTDQTWSASKWLKVLGPEPLLNHFSGAYLHQKCRQRKTAIKTFVMDAATVVGVGNIYASESLFLAGIHPKRAAGNISKKRIHRLVSAIQQTLQAAIQAGGSSISDFVKVDGKPGYFSHTFKVYGREGEACEHCDSKIQRITQSGRSTFYCSTCQR